MKEFLFIGETRSNTAKKMGYHWGDEVLSGKTLFRALRANGIDPTEQVYANLWNDCGKLDSETLELLVLAGTSGLIVVAMGRKVQSELQRLNVSHVEIPHPAARGNYRKHGVYEESVKQRLHR